MIDLKQAAKIALDYFCELYPAEDIPNLTLEEVELSEDRKSWLVTVSFSNLESAAPIDRITGNEPRRTYKVLRIDPESGDVRGMTMRHSLDEPAAD